MLESWVLYKVLPLWAHPAGKWGKQPTVMLLKLAWVSDSPRRLVKTWVPGAHPSEILIQ